MFFFIQEKLFQVAFLGLSFFQKLFSAITMVHKMQRMALSQSPSNANANSTAAAATAAAATTTANTTTPQPKEPESESSAKTERSTVDGVQGSKPVVAGGHKKPNPFV
jgi:hypothetical protein